MRSIPRGLVLAPLLLAGASLALPAGSALAGPPAEYPLAGTRSITTARAGIAPQCLTVDSKSRVTVASLCFKEGEHHSWSLKYVAGRKDLYVLERGANCLTLDVTRTPHLLGAPCDVDVRQIWQLAERSPGEHQIGQNGVCVQAKAGEVTTAPCAISKDGSGRDDSGQAWKVLASPHSVIPDTPLGDRKGRDGR